MRIQHAFSVLCLVFGAGCAQRVPIPLPAPQTAQVLARPSIGHRPRISFTPLYSFTGGRIAGGTDGAFPKAGLTVLRGALYGTTAGGGVNNAGTTFEVSTSGKERVVAAFNTLEGSQPMGNLLNVAAYGLGEELLGTTQNDGGDRSGAGTVFLATPARSSLRLAHVFKAAAPEGGLMPEAGVVFLDGKFYGTTYEGGIKSDDCAQGCGTIFELDSQFVRRTIHKFDPGVSLHEGWKPRAELTVLNGALYGVTTEGGRGGGTCHGGCGAAFEVRPDGTYRTLATFAGTDGANPEAALTLLNGMLYGTTNAGGSSGYGIVYSLDPSTGAKVVLHSFSGAGGAFPRASLTVMNGALYGTTYGGGSAALGTVFEIQTDGTFRSIHSFNGTDGANPWGTLAVLNGMLYGTTENGGTGNCSVYGRGGCGTIFALAP